MTDELYTLYLDTFTMKLSGVDCSTLADLRAKHPTMQQRCNSARWSRSRWLTRRARTRVPTRAAMSLRRSSRCSR